MLKRLTYFREGLLQGQQLALQDPTGVQLSEVWQVGRVHQAILCAMPHKQALQSLLGGRSLLCQPTHNLQFG